jgi:acetolactate synthase-1/2/3 large subunit
MKNPDFKAWAKSYGANAYTIIKDEEFETCLDKALNEEGPVLLHLKLDSRDIAPGKVIEG